MFFIWLLLHVSMYYRRTPHYKRQVKLTLSANQQERNTIRQAVRAKRRALSIEDQQIAANKLSQTLIALPQLLAAKTVALYIANDGEIALTPFIAWCWRQGKQVALPVIHPFSKGHLLFLRYDSTTQLIANQFNINEPKLSVEDVIPFSQIDAILTPLVAFDQRGGRLGMGGGFYDRTLANWHAQAQQNQSHSATSNHLLYPLGVAHDCQEIAAVPIDEWDIPLPKIITPTKTVIGNL